MPGVYSLLVHKYYVDELYDAAIVQPIKLLSTGGLWKGVDAGVDRRRRQRRRARRCVRASGGLRRAADRVGPDLCGVALSRASC